jgi:O-antigen/teichoic acid export membrane protein
MDNRGAAIELRDRLGNGAIQTAAADFRKAAFMTAGANGVIAALAFCTGSLSARLLGVQGRGELAAIQMWPSAVAGFAALGLPEAVVYFAARDPERAASYLSSALGCALAAVIPFSLLGYALMPVLLRAQAPWVVADARWYMSVFPAVIAVGGTLLISLRARGHFLIWNVFRTAPAIGLLAVLAAAWLYNRATPGFVAAGTVLMWLLMAGALAHIVLRRIPGPYLPHARQSGAMLRYGLPSVLGGLPQLLNYRLDQILMASMLPAQMLGFYVVAVAWSGALSPVLSAVGSVLFPHIASQASSQRRALLFPKAIRLSALTSLCLAAGLLLITPWAITLVFGPAFHASIRPACVLVIAAAAATVNTVLEEGIRGLGRPGVVTRAEFVGLAVTFVALLVLLPRMGIMGAALASMMAYGTVSAVLLLESCWLTGCRISDLLVPASGEILAEWGRLLAALRAARWSG